MFNIGAGEMILIALVLLIAVGPEQLPGVIRRAGQVVSQVRTMSEGLRRDLMDSMDEIERASDPRKWADTGFDSAQNMDRWSNPPANLIASDGPTPAEDGSDEPNDEAASEPVSDEPIDERAFEPVSDEPATEPGFDEPGIDEPVGDESATIEAPVDEITTNGAPADQSGSGLPLVDEAVEQEQ